MLEKGDLLVPIETPYGPAQAREAWADELGNLLVVVRVLDDRRVRVNCPSTGETVERTAADLLESYERSDAGEPQSWARFIMRVATECARVERRAGEDDDTYWRRVAAVATRVRVEESDFAKEELAPLADLSEKQLGPFVSTSETSRRAALANYPKQGTQRQRLVELMYARHLSAVQERGRALWDVAKFELRAGSTRFELGDFMRMPTNTVGPRVKELIVGGWVRESEQVRETPFGREAAVLVLTEKAIEYLTAEAA